MKLTDWIKGMRERRMHRSFKRSEKQFRHDARLGLYDAILESVARNRMYPSVTGEQAQALWDSGFFRKADRIGDSGWHRVMEALKQTEWGKRQEWRLSGLNAGNEILSQKLNAEYVLMCSRKDKAAGSAWPDMEADEIRAAHRLLGHCMREQELLELKELALHGKRPGDVALVRNGLLDGFRKIRELERQRADEMRGDNHSTAYGIDVEIAEETGRLMRASAGLYESRLCGKLPEDYLEALRKERDTLRYLSVHGWDGDMRISRNLQMKYGMVRDFQEAGDLWLDYIVRCDLNGDTTPAPDMKGYGDAIRAQSRREAERLERKLSPQAMTVRQSPATADIRQPVQGLQRYGKNEVKFKI